MKQFDLANRSLLKVIFAIALVCSDAVLADEPTVLPAPRSYLQLPAGGEAASLPYLWERSAGAKHLVVLGTRHLRNGHALMYDRIEAAFVRLRPQLVIHESQIPEDLKIESTDAAIARAADLGFAAQLAHRQGVPLRSGDAPAKDEIQLLLSAHDPEDVFVFLVAQRLVGSLRRPDPGKLAVEYPAFARDYLAANGLALRTGWETWKGFLEAYRRVTGRVFASATWAPDLLSPLHDTGRLSQVVRNSEAIRDRYLLTAIREALRTHDRVLVVFGYWHVLAIEPMLTGLLE